MSEGGPEPTSAEGQFEGREQGAASEEELRAAYEEELRRITVTDVIAQAAVSLLNLAAQRLGPPPDGGAEGGEPARDLEQVRDGIDGAKALLSVLERRIPQEVRPLRDALAQLQMAYASAVGSSGGEAAPGAEEGEAAKAQPGGAQQAGSGGDAGGAGPAESSGRLWIPGR